MALGAIDDIGGGQNAASSQAGVNPGGESRALVLSEPRSARERPAPYRESTFLAHLIATREQLPQTRARRRAEPDEAVRAYQAMAKLAVR
ncbi:MAG TPA: hypothetical protein VG986_18595 [Pseudolabrys sp.]|nr:hypothetical protein [Pseudolabrys sp.]